MMHPYAVVSAGIVLCVVAAAEPKPDYSKAETSFTIGSARWPSSPRSSGTAVDRVVVHSSFAKAKPRADWFGKDAIFAVWRDQKDSQGKPYLSVHYFIDRGGKVYQLVPEAEVANHAKGYNSRSIGIELAGIADDFAEEAKKGGATDQDLAYTDAQYKALSDLLTDAARRWPGVKAIRHSDVEKHSGLKKDPGAKFETSKLTSKVVWVTEP